MLWTYAENSADNTDVSITVIKLSLSQPMSFTFFLILSLSHSKEWANSCGVF